MHAYEQAAISIPLHLLNVWEQCTQLESFFHHINTLHQNIKFKVEKKSDRELAFLSTFLKWNKWKISVLVYKKPVHTDQYLHYSSHHQAGCKESVVSSLFNREYSIITNEDDLTKKNARTNQVLKENGYQERIISKIFQRITNNHSFSQSQQQIQAIDIQEEETRMSMSINWVYIQGAGEKQWYMLRSHIIGSTFYSESTFHKLPCESKDWVTTEDKSNIIYEIESSNLRQSTLVNLIVFKMALRWTQKICQELSSEKNEIAKHCWEADHTTLTGISMKLLIGKG